jgi:hypothetical protein
MNLNETNCCDFWSIFLEKVDRRSPGQKERRRGGRKRGRERE